MTPITPVTKTRTSSVSKALGDIVAALGTKVGYLGAMGSRRTHAQRVSRLRHAGVEDRDLGRVMALHWRAPVAQPLGSWLLRSAEGFTHRANSVLAAGLPGLDLGAAVARVAPWYAELVTGKSFDFVPPVT